MLNSRQERELAYLVRIDDITPIDGYDRVELAHVAGWTVVVGKDELFSGDLAIYFEIDSQLPEKEPFSKMEFLAKKKFKIKTQKMCKSISQGFICPINAFSNYECLDENSIIDKQTKEIHSIQDDTKFLTKELNVTYAATEDNIRKGASKKQDKYQKMLNKNPKLVKNKFAMFLYKFNLGKKLLFAIYGKNVRDYNWPEWVARTDEERCLVADTKIITDKGKLRISDIVNKRLNVRVKSINNNGKIEFKNIVSYQKYKNNDGDLIKFKIPNGFMNSRNNTLICTPDHKLLTECGYKEAKDINLNDKLFILTKSYSDNFIKYIYGNILGDGYLWFDKRKLSNYKFGFSFSQGETHKEYLDLLNRLYHGSKIRKEFSGYKSDGAIYKFGIENLDTLNYYLSKDKVFDYSNNWHITKEFCNRLTIESLALWYLDDGSCSFNGSCMKKSPGIATASYTEEENLLLIDCLKNRFGYEVKLNKGKYFDISFNRESGRKFFEDIADFVPDSMKYKLPEDLRDRHCKLYDEVINIEDRALPVDIFSIEVIYNKNKFNSRYVYDIEVEDNHNFFASNIVNHNCQNIPYIVQDKSPWIVTEKIDGTSTTFTLKKNNKGKREYFVCSRNVCFGDDDSNLKNDICYYESNVYKEMSLKYKVKDFLNWYMDEFGVDWVTLQGETYGEGVQKRTYSIKEHRLAGFNLIDSKNGRLSSISASFFAEKFGIPWVPILDNKYILPDTIEELLEYANGVSILDGLPREGVVFRSPDGKRSFKAVSNEFLLKYHS